MIKGLTFAAAALALSFSTRSAQAQTAPTTSQDFVATTPRGDFVQEDDRAGFGHKGQWTFSTDNSIQISRTTQNHASATTSLTVAPAVDYFVIPNLSVGGQVGIDFQKVGDNRSVLFTLGPRVGYNVEISKLLSFWPKIGISYGHSKNKDSAGVSVKGNAATLNIYAPVMLHPAKHFFAGFGPFVDTDMNGDNRATTWGFKLTLGGWINPSESRS